MKKNEVRFFASHLRAERSAAGEGQEGEHRTIAGYAIRFNEESVVLHDWGTRFVEKISPSCVTEEMLRGCDIKMTMFHNREKLLARWNKGEGTLRLSVDDQGVYFEFEVPDNELGRYCLEAVERGDIAGCSFTFWPGDYLTEERGDEEVLITHTRFDALTEMTVDSDPAYPTTEVSTRSFCEGVKNKRDADSKVVAEVREKAERSARERYVALTAAEIEELDRWAI